MWRSTRSSARTISSTGSTGSNACRRIAASAYNAGPGRAQAWRAGAPLEGAVWVETIPFNETRDYVKKVLANAMIYARALEQTFVPLTTRLGTVPPRGNGTGMAVVAGDY